MDDSELDDERLSALQTQIDKLRSQLAHNDTPQTDVVVLKDPAPAEGLMSRPTELPEYDGKSDHYPV
ncbi:hypothetical protein K3495_g3154 [Podosphaera aphanis]|nr:hypothetical protein K3495_g3154 [Podosphaera aphanis]